MDPLIAIKTRYTKTSPETSHTGAFCQNGVVSGSFFFNHLLSDNSTEKLPKAKQLWASSPSLLLVALLLRSSKPWLSPVFAKMFHVFATTKKDTFLSISKASKNLERLGVAIEKNNNHHQQKQTSADSEMHRTKHRRVTAIWSSLV